MSFKPLSTNEAAREVGITRATLQAWIKEKKIVAPKPTLDGARSKRLWKEPDLARLRETKEAIYRKGSGRRRKKK